MRLKNHLVKLSADKRLYQLSVPVVGLTGGIASGKSTVSQRLKAKGLAVIDADHLVKTIYSTPEAIRFVSLKFPEAVENNQINFKLLRQKVFLSEEAKKLVEEFIYQRLPDAFLSAFHKFKDPECVIYDVPLLFEKGLEGLVDINVLVYAPRKTQQERLMDRDGHLEVMAKNILDQQMDIEEKKKKAEFIIDNSQTLKELAENIEEFLRQSFTVE